MNKDDLQLVLLGLGTLGTFILIFINLPQAINRWSPIFNSPPPAILDWIQNISIAGFAFTTGWLLKSKLTVTTGPTLEIEQDNKELPVEEAEEEDDGEDGIVEIKPCVEVNEVCWTGVAETDGDQVSLVDFFTTPICPECQTGLLKGGRNDVSNSELRDEYQKKDAVALTHMKLWDCPSCWFHAEYESGDEQRAVSVIGSQLQKLIAGNEEYSVFSTRERYQEEEERKPTPREYWEEYAETVDDDQVSVNCFH